MPDLTERARILIVDDEELSIRVIDDILRGAGYRNIESTTNPFDALVLYQSFQPDLVILDLVMPRLSGFKVLKQIRAVTMNGTYLPILVLTADVRTESRHEALASGATDFLNKPYDNTELVLRVRTLLETRLLHLQLHEKNHALEAQMLETRRLTAAVHNLSAGVIITDPDLPDNPIIFSNPGFCAITGYSEQEVLGRNCRFLQGVATDQEVVQEIREAISQEKPFSGRLLNYRRDGTPFWNRLTINPIFDEQQRLVNFIGIQMDVTAQVRVKEALEASEERFRVLFDENPLMVLTVDEAGIIRSINRFGASQLGYAPEDIMGTRLSMIFHQEDRQAAMEYLTNCFHAPGKPETIELRKVCKDGSLLWVRETARAIHGWNDGRVALMVCEDITERKQAEAALFESEERFRQFAEHLETATLWITNKTLDGVEYLSPPVEKIWGLKRSSFYENPRLFVDAVHPGDRKIAEMHNEKTMRGPDEAEYRIVRPDSEIRWIWDCSFPIRDASGKILRLAGIGTDITERKQAEEAIRFQAHILNSIGEAVITTDPTGRILYSNRSAESLYGWSSEEVIGKEVIEVTTPHFRRQQAAEIMERLRHGENWTGEFSVQRRDGATFDVHVTNAPLLDERGNVMAIVGISRDITELKENEEALRAAKDEAERANQAKSEFLSRMSHELRTPLNAILGFGQLLQMDVTTPQDAESVQQILKAGQHLLELINEVLDISRIETGRLALSIEPVAVSEVMDEVIALVRPLAASRNVQLHAASCARHVVADRQRLKQALLNLFSNAIKYNHEGGSVMLDMAEGASQDTWRLSVRDTGVGIAPEDLPKLFTPFERLSAAETKIEGTGLGLAITKRLVEILGGSLSVKSTLGEGSTFTIELPLAESPVEQLERAGGVAMAEAIVPHSACTLLYIEDNLANLRLIERLIVQRPEIKLFAALQGNLGLELAREHKPDLILLDLHLPDINGDVVLEQLKRDPRTAAVPVVMLSADATQSQIERLKALGAHEYLTKPLDVRRFLALLDELVANE